jgi:membrane glycosyltransferase
LPPNLTEYLKRDRRWCQGNLQHLWLVLERKIRGISRLHLLTGYAAYASAPLYVLFILLSGLQAALDHLHHRAGHWLPSSLVLLLLTLSLLLGPRVLSLLHLFSRPQDLKLYGGALRVTAGVILETVFSTLVAPIMVWFHTRFVLRNLAGHTVSWDTQTRDGGNGPKWGDVLAEYWPLPVAGAVLSAFAWWIDPFYARWLAPFLLGLWLAVFIVQLGGRKGVLSRLFQIPEETAPPPELTHNYRLNLREGDGFVHALLDPYYNAVHVSLQRKRGQSAPAVERYVANLATKLFRAGPDALTMCEKRAVLADGATVARLHDLIWRTPGEFMNPFWARAIEGYRRRRPLPALEAQIHAGRASALLAA